MWELLSNLVFCNLCLVSVTRLTMQFELLILHSELLCLSEICEATGVLNLFVFASPGHQKTAALFSLSGFRLIRCVRSLLPFWLVSSSLKGWQHDSWLTQRKIEAPLSRQSDIVLVSVSKVNVSIRQVWTWCLVKQDREDFESRFLDNRSDLRYKTHRTSVYSGYWIYDDVMWADCECIHRPAHQYDDNTRAIRDEKSGLH